MVNNKHNKGEIMLNTTVIYTNGIKEVFEALQKTNKGVIIGRILEGKFVDCGFIAKEIIANVCVIIYRR